MQHTFPSEFIGGILFVLFGCLTWFFSTRRGLFMKVFVRDKSEREQCDKQLPNEKDFKRCCRILAAMEISIGIIIYLIGK